jgi:hypothetical protein
MARCSFFREVNSANQFLICFNFTNLSVQFHKNKILTTGWAYAAIIHTKPPVLDKVRLPVNGTWWWSWSSRTNQQLGHLTLEILIQRQQLTLEPLLKDYLIYFKLLLQTWHQPSICPCSGTIKRHKCNVWAHSSCTTMARCSLFREVNSANQFLIYFNFTNLFVQFHKNKILTNGWAYAAIIHTKPPVLDKVRLPVNGTWWWSWSSTSAERMAVASPATPATCCCGACQTDGAMGYRSPSRRWC